jgi:hypothetical protein
MSIATRTGLARSASGFGTSLGVPVPHPFMPEVTNVEMICFWAKA